MQDSKIDLETSNLISQEKLIEQIVNHEGWHLIEEIFSKEMASLTSILEIDTDADLASEIKSRRLAVACVKKILDSIKGTASKSLENISLINNEKNFIIKK
jgi:hypothetical protein